MRNALGRPRQGQLQQAGVTYGDGDFSRWLNGEWAEPDFDRPWIRTVRAATTAGKRMPRVRVVSEPWSDYTKFGMYAARGNIDAGENIRSLPRPRAADLGLPVQMPGYDYWLFDSRFIVVLHFDDETNDITRIEVPRNPYLILEPFASSLQVIVPFPSGRLRGSSHPVTLK